MFTIPAKTSLRKILDLENSFKQAWTLKESDGNGKGGEGKPQLNCFVCFVYRVKEKWPLPLLLFALLIQTSHCKPQKW